MFWRSDHAFTPLQSNAPLVHNLCGQLLMGAFWSPLMASGFAVYTKAPYIPPLLWMHAVLSAKAVATWVKKDAGNYCKKQFLISIKSSNFSSSINAAHCKGGYSMGRDVWQKVKNPLLIISGAAFLAWFALFSPCH